MIIIDILLSLYFIQIRIFLKLEQINVIFERDAIFIAF